MDSFPIFKIRWVIRTKVCFVHPRALNFDSTAFVPRAQLRIVCPKGFYGYCSHSSLTLAVKLRMNVMQEMISASRSEFKCRNHTLLGTE